MGSSWRFVPHPNRRDVSGGRCGRKFNRNPLTGEKNCAFLMFSFQIKPSRCTFWWENESFHDENCQLHESHIYCLSAKLDFFHTFLRRCTKQVHLFSRCRVKKEIHALFCIFTSIQKFFWGGYTTDTGENMKRKKFNDSTFFVLSRK